MNFDVINRLMGDTKPKKKSSFLFSILLYVVCFVWSIFQAIFCKSLIFVGIAFIFAINFILKLNSFKKWKIQKETEENINDEIWDINFDEYDLDEEGEGNFENDIYY